MSVIRCNVVASVAAAVAGGGGGAVGSSAASTRLGGLRASRCVVCGGLLECDSL